jgi:hypothetical protein
MISTRSQRRQQEGRYHYAANSITFSHDSNLKYNFSLSMHSWHVLPSFIIKQHSFTMQCHLTTCPLHFNLNGPSGAWHQLAPAKSTVRMAEEKTDAHRKNWFQFMQQHTLQNALATICGHFHFLIIVSPGTGQMH